MISSSAPAILPSSSNAATQSPGDAGTPLTKACPWNTPEDGVGVTNPSQGLSEGTVPPLGVKLMINVLKAGSFSSRLFEDNISTETIIPPNASSNWTDSKYSPQPLLSQVIVITLSSGYCKSTFMDTAFILLAMICVKYLSPIHPKAASKAGGGGAGGA